MRRPADPTTARQFVAEDIRNAACRARSCCCVLTRRQAASSNFLNSARRGGTAARKSIACFV